MDIGESKLSLEEINETISVRSVLPSKAIAMLVVAHGAGVGIDHQFMVDIQKELAEVQIATFSFNFVYMEKRKRVPYRMTRPINTFKEVWSHVKATYDYPLFGAGKSYGGRVASSASDDLSEILGLIFLGYPFHPPGKLDKLRTEHLYKIGLPMLFLQGTRDGLSNEEIANDFVSQHPSSSIIWLEDGDHSWKPRKRSGLTQQDLMKRASLGIREFCKINVDLD